MFVQFALVVTQYYDTDVNKAYVIRGNAAVLKCEIPSFVADFVSVVSWHTDQNEDFLPGSEYGLFSVQSVYIFEVMLYYRLMSSLFPLPCFHLIFMHFIHVTEFACFLSACL